MMVITIDKVMETAIIPFIPVPIQMMIIGAKAVFVRRLKLLDKDLILYKEKELNKV